MSYDYIINEESQAICEAYSFWIPIILNKSIALFACTRSLTHFKTLLV